MVNLKLFPTCNVSLNMM